MEERTLDQRGRVRFIILEDDGRFPNNGMLPLLLYPKALEISGADAAAAVESLFRKNGWVNSWRNGIYSYQHYHSKAHEALGVYKGFATVLLGGEQGLRCEIRAGDAIVIPAGVAHMKLSSTEDFRVVGAYPVGQRVDMRYGDAAERPRADENIRALPKPDADPLAGNSGLLTELWGA
jgi:uncharacterized protein YjlB